MICFLACGHITTSSWHVSSLRAAVSPSRSQFSRRGWNSAWLRATTYYILGTVLGDLHTLFHQVPIFERHNIIISHFSDGNTKDKKIRDLLKGHTARKCQSPYLDPRPSDLQTQNIWNVEAKGLSEHWGRGRVMAETSQITDKETLAQSEEGPSEARVTYLL